MVNLIRKQTFMAPHFIQLTTIIMNHVGEISHLKQYIGWHLYIHVNGSHRSCLEALFRSHFRVK